jgi:hypothetical protein
MSASVDLGPLIIGAIEVELLMLDAVTSGKSPPPLPPA